MTEDKIIERVKNAAFPQRYDFEELGHPIYNLGLTKREYFAAMAMQGMLASEKKFTLATIAVDSVQMADALIAMLYQPKP